MAEQSIKTVSSKLINHIHIIRRHLVLAVLVSAPLPVLAQSFTCNPPLANQIVCENSMTGSPQSEWDVSGYGDSTVQGFATDISVNAGQTISFKIATPASSYTIDIYRLGYYGGMGARKIITIQPSAAFPQNQPDCLTDSATGLFDCGNWGVSASWPVPSNATSGIYIALLTRPDTGGKSHIPFIVRNDAGHSDIVFQTSDTTWQAYNWYGGTGTGAPGQGRSLYGCSGGFNASCRAFKVSYNRPFDTRGTYGGSADYLFAAEYPMVRWLEANGYDVSYISDVDTDRNGALLLNHKIFSANGHDEYWSGAQRTNVETARSSGVNLAFFTANQIFWKTRWENSIDGSNTSYRTLITYKETSANAVIDPADPSTWTGTWRDARFSPPADGGRPENALAGNLFMVNGPVFASIIVPQADGQMRFWRNTPLASLPQGQSYTFANGTIGEEINADIDNGFRPAGLFPLSTTDYSANGTLLLDEGSTFGTGQITHHMTLYRYPTKGLVFGAGTFNWAWGLDSAHDVPNSLNPNPPVDTNVRQATVNLFADMGVQPASLSGGLLLATASTDTTPPTSVITSPSSGNALVVGNVVTITGTATDAGGGAVGAVEVSIDGGTTWHPAVGRGNWTYNWTPNSSGSTTIKSRAGDDSGNLETPSAGVSVTISSSTANNGYSLWGSTFAPSVISSGDPQSVELGLKFTADFDGYIAGIRFYKGPSNTGTHTGNLWSSTGSMLASATFSGESLSGWQQVNLSSPVAITAGTVYVVSYHTNIGEYSYTRSYFTSAYNNPPLHALQDSVNSGNGVYAYGAVSVFPTNTSQSSNYWVDVVYQPASSFVTLSSISLNPTSVTGGSSSTGTVTLNMAAPSGGAVVTLSSNNSAVTVPVSAVVSASANSVNFPVITKPVATNTAVTISGGLNGVQTTSLAVNTPVVSAVSLNPTQVIGGSSSSGTVTLSGPAPTGGVVVTLSSSVPSVAAVPTSVMVSAGATGATFVVTTVPVGSVTSVSISATYGVTRSTTLSVISLATITFDNISPANRVLTGQYPTGVINWGTGTNWYLSAPWGLFTTQSISFNGASMTSANFTFISNSGLAGLQAYNGGTGSSTVTISCSGQTTLTRAVTAGTVATISTGWTSPCATVTLASSNGWNTNFDNLSVFTAPDFTVSASPSSNTVLQGNSTTYTATIGALNGFGGIVNLSVTGAPTGTTTTFNPTSVTGLGTSTLTVSTTTGAPAGSYTLKITGTSGTLSRSANVTLVVGQPDFSLSVTPSSQTAVQANPTSYTATVDTLNGFAGVVGFSVTGLPTGTTGTFTPTSVTGSGTSLLSITTSNATPLGSYTVTVTGTSGALVHSATVTLVVVQPDFSLSVSPASRTIVQGNGTTYTATVTALNGFSAVVTLTVTGLPDGATGTFTPTSVTGSGTSTLSITTSGTTPLGSYTVTLTGTSGSLTHSTTTTLVVNPSPDFSLTATPSSQTVLAGGSTSYTATVGALNGFTSVVSLTVTGLPMGTTGAFTPASVTGSGSSTLNVTTASTTLAGSYTLTVTGTSGSLTRSATATLLVNVGQPDFTLSATPASQIVVQGNPTSYTATIAAFSGFADVVNLTLTGLPAGAGGTFSPISVTGSGSSTLNVTTGVTTPLGTYILTITGTSGSVTHSANVTLTVNSPETTISFDDLSPANRVLTAQYPTGVINWGTGTNWYLSAPWGLFTTQSISFNGASMTSASFSFVSTNGLASVQAYNGGSSSATVAISCTGQTTVQATVPAGTISTISTGWTAPCATVTVTTSNGWDTNFDNLVYF